MESSLNELSKYRFQRACEDLNDAKLLMDAKSFKSSVNRSYVKEGIFDKSLSKMLDKAYRLRECADYKDFEIISREKAEEQIQRAEKIMAMIKPYLDEKWEL